MVGRLADDQERSRVKVNSTGRVKLLLGGTEDNTL